MSKAREPSSRGATGDVLVVLAFATLTLGLGLMRQEYIGDGVRHVPAAVGGVYSFGEARWLLFPPALTGWIAGARALHLVEGVRSALVAFVVLDVLAGAAYLLALRSLLGSLGAPARVRAEGLALAGFLAPLLLLTSDTAEPMVAAAFAVGGIAVVAGSMDSPGNSSSALRLGLGIVLIGLGSLLYQGVVLALLFLPALPQFAALSRGRAPLVAAACLVGIGVAFVVILMAGEGVDLGGALSRLSTISGNELYNDWVKSSFRFPRVVALAAGPPQAIFHLKDFTGMRSLLRGLTDSEMRASAALTLGALFAGAGICAGLVLAVIRGGRRPLLVALAGIAVLPVILRPSQYGYVKFWVLFPVFAAIASVHLSSRLRITIAAVVAVFNLVAAVTDVAAGRVAYADRAATYGEATDRTCWVDAAWGPRIPQAWPGGTCSLLTTMGGGHGRTMEQLAERNGHALRSCLRWCFCEADGTWTDNFTTANAASIRSVADHFLLRRVDVAPLLWDGGGAGLVKMGRGATMPVLVYSDGDRQARCASLGTE